MRIAAFTAILKRYMAGKASKEEEKVVDGFLDSFNDSDDGLSLKTERERDALRSEIFARIQARIAKGRTHVIPLWMKIAASVSILFVVAFVLRLAWQPALPSTLTYVTRAGETSTVVLPDSSVVTLHFSSTLVVPVPFSGDERSVKLTGEAFFNVTPDKEKPFVVSSGKLITTVVGTSFNVREIPGIPSSVSVATGAVTVRLSDSQAGDEMLLHPSEEALLTGNQLHKRRVNLSDVGAWTDGMLVFDNISMAEVAAELERWYGVRVIFRQDKLKHCFVRAKYRSDSLSSLLDNLSVVLNMEYSIEGTTVVLDGGECN